MYGAAGGLPYYEELGRTKLTGAGDLISVSLSETMPYLMVLTTMIDDTTDNAAGAYYFNADPNGDYAARYNGDFGSDSTASNSNYIYLTDGMGAGTHGFGVITVTDTDTTHEKLTFAQAVANRTGTGSANAPNQWQVAGKYVPDSSANISSVEIYNQNTGNFDTDSEAIVLGYTGANTGSNFWEELASVEVTGASTDTLDTGTFTSKPYLYVEYHCIPDGNIDIAMQANSLTSNDYAKREYDDFTGAGTQGNMNYFGWGKGSGGANDSFGYGFLQNVSSQEKLWQGWGMDNGGGGTGNAPSTRMNAGKLAKTDQEITSLQLIENGQSGQLGVGTTFRVWGGS